MVKKVSIGAVGFGLGQIETLAKPIQQDYSNPNEADLPITLRSNENPYGPSPLAQTEMAKNINKSNRYGWKITSELINEIAKKENVKVSNILTGAGSTKLLELVFLHAALKKGSFVIAEPTYDYWTNSSKNFRFTKISVQLNSNKEHDLSAMLAVIKPDTKLIYICNPNNPTGTICKKTALISFINKIPKNIIVLVDEAYIDFTNEESLSSEVSKNDNLIITKTFSKLYGLAGARIGYAIANETVVNELSQLQSWPNGSVSAVSAAGALASLKDNKFKEKSYFLNEKAKKYTIEQLEKLNITCIPTNANFIYFSLSKYKKDFFKQLEMNSILGTKIYEEKGKWSRITIGTMAEMQLFITALQ